MLHTPKGLNAIQILTIHKAKGLEFPVVILPFLDDPIQGSHRTQVWAKHNRMVRGEFE